MRVERRELYADTYLEVFDELLDLPVFTREISIGLLQRETCTDSAPGISDGWASIHPN